MAPTKKGLLERLAVGPVIGDGGFVFALEKRGYVKAEFRKQIKVFVEEDMDFLLCEYFEPYHIRAVAEELSEERGKMPEGHEKHDMWGTGLRMHTKPWVRARANREYWEKLKPASGRPFCPSMSPDNWGVTAGDSILKQQAEETTAEQLREVMKMKK